MEIKSTDHSSRACVQGPWVCSQFSHSGTLFSRTTGELDEKMVGKKRTRALPGPQACILLQIPHLGRGQPQTAFIKHSSGFVLGWANEQAAPSSGLRNFLLALLTPSVACPDLSKMTLDKNGMREIPKAPGGPLHCGYPSSGNRIICFWKPHRSTVYSHHLLKLCKAWPTLTQRP